MKKLLIVAIMVLSASIHGEKYCCYNRFWRGPQWSNQFCTEIGASLAENYNYKCNNQTSWYNTQYFFYNPFWIKGKALWSTQPCDKIRAGNASNYNLKCDRSTGWVINPN